MYNKKLQTFGSVRQFICKTKFAFNWLWHKQVRRWFISLVEWFRYTVSARVKSKWFVAISQQISSLKWDRRWAGELRGERFEVQIQTDKMETISCCIIQCQNVEIVCSTCVEKWKMCYRFANRFVIQVLYRFSICAASFGWVRWWMLCGK